MHQILSFPNKARTTDRYIGGVAEHVAHYPDFSELFEARQEGYAKLGNDALALTEQLSSKYKIKATHKADLGFDWDVGTFLRNKIAEIEKRRNEREQRSVDLLDDLSMSAKHKSEKASS